MEFPRTRSTNLMPDGLGGNNSWDGFQERGRLGQKPQYNSSSSHLRLDTKYHRKANNRRWSPAKSTGSESTIQEADLAGIVKNILMQPGNCQQQRLARQFNQFAAQCLRNQNFIKEQLESLRQRFDQVDPTLRSLDFRFLILSASQTKPELEQRTVERGMDEIVWQSEEKDPDLTV